MKEEEIHERRSTKPQSKLINDQYFTNQVHTLWLTAHQLKDQVEKLTKDLLTVAEVFGIYLEVEGVLFDEEE